ncbi:RCC1 domain-containing protein [Azospira restricta]|uniref:RCC1-like domain-containing protein n=1 Tax=Azospira restricta TaxID=404405 RepID=A0A974PWH6_9RHOO|nr:hypothetical protein [Azospira restricta]QRJ62509.1 hypothetical protein IWH25_12035 [Azospira restricta]
MKGRCFCFLTLLISVSAFAQVSPKTGVWHGTIGDSPIMLCVEAQKAAYYYAGKSEEIALGMNSAGSWSESVKGTITGQWKIHAQSASNADANRVDGSWRNPRGKGEQPFWLWFVGDDVAACSSETYRRTLLVPNEPRLSLPIPQVKPGVAAAADSAAVLKANGELWQWSVREPLPKRTGEGFVRIALGSDHLLGIKSDGSLWGWGSNNSGQLGGERVEGSWPVRMGEGYVALAANRDFSLAIRKDGTLWAWGGLQRDAKGNAFGDRKAKPTLIGKAFISVAAGEDFFVAIRSDSTLWTWGNNRDGQLGTEGGGSWFGRRYGYETLPVLVGGDFAQVSAGYGHVAAIKRDGSLWTWGHGTWGKLGNGTDSGSSRSPVKIGDGFAQVVAGFLNTAAVKTDGSLWLWGANRLGMFGDCTTATHTRPVQIGKGYVQVALGHDFLLALKDDGSEWTSGWAWEGDQLDTAKACRKPARVVFGDGVSGWDKAVGNELKAKLQGPPMPADIISIAAGRIHSAMVKADGTLWTWGSNEYGQLANGTTEGGNRPRQVGEGYRKVSINDWYTLALKEDGSLLRWGAIPTTYPRGNFSRSMEKALAPTKVSPGTVELLRSGYQMGRGIGLRNDGTLADWLYYWDVAKPPQVFGRDIKVLAVGYFGRYALRADGSLWELSDYPLSPPPKEVGRNFLTVAVGFGHAYGIKADGSLWAWGENSAYQLGDGTKIDRADPVRIGEGFVQVAIGRFHGVALAADGSVWTWGSNEVGAIGDGTTTARSRPTRIGTGFARVAAGDYHTLALKTDGTLWAWGANEEGQLGDGTHSKRLSPVRVYPAAVSDGGSAPLPTPAADGQKTPGRTVTGVRVGLYFSCVSFTDGRYMCWGSNSNGQLGHFNRWGKNPTPTVVEPREGAAGLFSTSRMNDCTGGACEHLDRQYPFLKGASATVFSSRHVCALKSGRIRCSAKDDGGDSRWIVDGVHDAIAFDYAADHGCALLADGRVKCWGSNTYGELGNGTFVTDYRHYSRPAATEVVGLP